MKKILSLFLVLLCVSTACAPAARTTVSDLVKADAAEETAEAGATPEPLPVNTLPVGAAVSGAVGEGYTLTHTVLLETDGFTISAERMTADSNGDHILTVRMENRTEEPLFAIPDKMKVNGYAVDPMWVGYTEPGGTEESDLIFPAEDIALLNLSCLDCLSFTLTVYTEDNLFTEELAESEITLWPTGLEGKDVLCPGMRHTENEALFLDKDGFTFVILGTEKHAGYGCVLLVWLENTSDDTAVFSFDGVTVNGISIDPYYAEAVPPRARCYSRVYFTDDDFRDNGITTVDGIEFTLSVYTEDTYETLVETDGTYKNF